MQEELKRGDLVNHRDVEAVLKPPKKCYERLTVEGLDGPIHFWASNVQHMLYYLLEASQAYKTIWLQEHPLDAVRLILYCDERTGGNVLATSSSKKALFFYVSLDGMHSVAQDFMWLPHAMVPARDVSMVIGGMAGCLQKILEHLSEQVNRGVCLLGRRYRLEIKAYVGDYDALSRSYMAKSASGLRPCLRCSNVLAKWTSVMDHPDASKHFHTISSDDVSGFRLLEHEELVSLFDELLAWSTTQSTAVRKEKERAFGFSLHSKSILASQPCRHLLPVTKVVYDSHHCYFSNGCAAEELLLFAARMPQSGVTLAMLRESVVETNWVCSDSDFRSKSSRSWLLNDTWFAGTFYKGSATQCWYLLPLFYYYIAALCGDCLPAEVACFGALMQARHCAVFQLLSFFPRFQSSI